jgi:MinD-like ATPase involved in chromosome partitioning or flagellar assembly
MPQIISIQSLRHGTGTSTLTANLAVCIAQEGWKVGVIDTDSSPPGIHTLFGLDEDNTDHLLNYLLWTEDGEYPRGSPFVQMGNGELTVMGGGLYLAPAQVQVREINTALRQGCDPLRLTQGFSEVIRKLRLDYLLIDSRPELDEEALLMITIADILLLVVSLENYILQGTAVTVDVARSLGIPHICLVANQVLSSFDILEVRQKLEETYGETVLEVLPFAEEMIALSSQDLFCRVYPDHPLTHQFQAIARLLITLGETSAQVTTTTDATLQVKAMSRCQQFPMLDLMTFPDQHKQLVYWLLSHGASTAREIAAHFHEDEATIGAILGTLTEQGVLQTDKQQSEVRYRVCLEQSISSD